MPRRLFFTAWVLAFGTALLLLWSVARVRLIGTWPVDDAELVLPAGSTAWHEVRFRAWGNRFATLHIDRRAEPGPPYRSKLELQVLDPRGRSAFHYRDPPTAPPRTLVVRPGDVHGPPAPEMQLHGLRVEGLPLRSWTLRARSAGAAAPASVSLHQHRYDPGMGGILLDLVLLPLALALFALAWLLARAYAKRGGSRWPARLGALGCAAALLALLVIPGR